MMQNAKIQNRAARGHHALRLRVGHRMLDGMGMKHVAGGRQTT